MEIDSIDATNGECYNDLVKRRVKVVDGRGNVVEKEIDVPDRDHGFRLDPTYLNLGMYLATPLLLGVFLGTYLDNRLGTKPIVTLVLIGLGLVSTFYNLYKIATNAQQRTKHQHKT